MSERYPITCIGHKAAGRCENLTGFRSDRGRKNPYWCPDCDEKRIAAISTKFDELSKKLDQLVVKP